MNDDSSIGADTLAIVRRMQEESLTYKGDSYIAASPPFITAVHDGTWGTTTGVTTTSPRPDIRKIAADIKEYDMLVPLLKALRDEYE